MKRLSWSFRESPPSPVTYLTFDSCLLLPSKTMKNQFLMLKGTKNCYGCHGELLMRSLVALMAGNQQPCLQQCLSKFCQAAVVFLWKETSMCQQLDSFSLELIKSWYLILKLSVPLGTNVLNFKNMVVLNKYLKSLLASLENLRSFQKKW